MMLAKSFGEVTASVATSPRAASASSSSRHCCPNCDRAMGSLVESIITVTATQRGTSLVCRIISIRNDWSLTARSVGPAAVTLRT